MQYFLLCAMRYTGRGYIQEKGHIHDQGQNQAKPIKAIAMHPAIQHPKNIYKLLPSSPKR